MYERFLRNFTGIDVPKSQQLEGLNFEVILTSDESERGCVVPVDIPPMAASGSIYEIPLRGLGSHNFYLRLHVSVEAGPG